MNFQSIFIFITLSTGCLHLVRAQRCADFNQELPRHWGSVDLANCGSAVCTTNGYCYRLFRNVCCLKSYNDRQMIAGRNEKHVATDMHYCVSTNALSYNLPYASVQGSSHATSQQLPYVGGQRAYLHPYNLYHYYKPTNYHPDQRYRLRDGYLRNWNHNTHFWGYAAAAAKNNCVESLKLTTAKPRPCLSGSASEPITERVVNTNVPQAPTIISTTPSSSANTTTPVTRSTTESSTAETSTLLPMSSTTEWSTVNTMESTIATSTEDTDGTTTSFSTESITTVSTEPQTTESVAISTESTIASNAMEIKPLISLNFTISNGKPLSVVLMAPATNATNGSNLCETLTRLDLVIVGVTDPIRLTGCLLDGASRSLNIPIIFAAIQMTNSSPATPPISPPYRPYSYTYAYSHGSGYAPVAPHDWNPYRIS